MGWTIDIFLIAVILINIFIGRKRGFAAMVLSLIASIAAIALAAEYSAGAGQWLNDNFIHRQLTAAISEKLTAVLNSGTENYLSAIPEYISSAAQANGISLSGLAAADIPQISEKLALTAETIFSPALSGAGFILIYLSVKAISAVIIAVVTTVFKLPVLRTVNKTLGGIVGAVKGIIFFAAACAALSSCSGILAGTPIGEAINSSLILNALGGTLSGLMVK